MASTPSYNSGDFWCEQIHRAVQWKNTYSTAQRWPDFWDYFEHRVDYPDIPQFNLVYMLGMALVPQLVFQRPHAINQARLPQYNTWARFFDGIDNWLVERMGLQSLIESAIISAYVTNIAAFAPGYDALPEDYPEKQLRDNIFPRIPGVINAHRRYQMPFVELIPTENLILPPRIRDERNFPWFGYKMTVPVRHLKQQADLRKQHISATGHDPDLPGAFHAASQTEGYQTFTIIHEAEKNTCSWVTDDGKFLYGPTEDPTATLMDGLPLRIVRFNPGKHGWGCPDVAYIESQYLEGNETRQDGRLQRKLALAKILVDASIMGENDVQAFMETASMGAIPIKLPVDKKMDDAVKIIQPHVQSEYQEYQRFLLNDSQLLLALGPNQLGTFAGGRRTARETRVVEQQHTLRIARRRHHIAEAIGDILGLANRFIAKNWTASSIQRVMGVDGAMYWVEASPKDFRDVPNQLISKVSVDSLAPTTRNDRREEMVEVLGALRGVQGGEQLMFPIIQQLLSTFDWYTVADALPQGNNGAAMPFQQFDQQQQAMMANPALNQQLANNLAVAQPRLLGSLPQGNNESRSNNQGRR